ncbi:hypothetical protein EVAR_9326_1 [Eumeta japonica]|uniref:Uncharacterized protein n=1 Tax=Eumeta variegata TaxID=151549 RepID=A0A4C1TM14_EUMVA|nr:hypothetical protein EVAR_9326_1 [Eumeta japonica]
MTISRGTGRKVNRKRPTALLSAFKLVLSLTQANIVALTNIKEFCLIFEENAAPPRFQRCHGNVISFIRLAPPIRSEFIKVGYKLVYRKVPKDRCRETNRSGSACFLVAVNRESRFGRAAPAA